MLIAYLCTRRGRAAIAKGLLGILAFSYGGLISSAALDALRIQADTLFIEAQVASREAPQPLYFQGDVQVAPDSPGAPALSLPADVAVPLGLPNVQPAMIAP
jgi:hypothetical protein